jgi:uncharacterized protein YndB with AHSA1/START domain
LGKKQAKQLNSGGKIGWKKPVDEILRVLSIAICTCALSCIPYFCNLQLIITDESSIWPNDKLYFQMKKNLILTKERHINATPLKVWTILTDNQWIEQWLGVQMITDWQPGSPIAFTFVYKDKEVKDKGTLLQFEPEKKLSYTYWSIFSATEDTPENYSEITLTITPNETGIVLQMTHVNFPSQMMVAHAEKNWEETLDTIKELAEEEAGYRP